MADIVFSPEAKRDLTETGDYIAFKLHNKSAARNLISRIQTTVMSLRQFPESGAPLSFAGRNIVYRYVGCGSYMII